jgi:AcrR family transcriptional regulator
MEEKQQLVIIRAYELFQKYGIKSVSMDDLARELGMSKKTLYQIVNDKGELVAKVMQYYKQESDKFLGVFENEELSALQQHMAQRSAALETYQRCNPVFAYDLKKYYPLLYQEMNESLKKAIYRAHYNNLEKGKQEGVYRADINSDIIARIMVVHHTYTFDPTSEVFDVAEVRDFNTLDVLYSYHLRGICTHEGLKKLKELIEPINNQSNDD